MQIAEYIRSLVAPVSTTGENRDRECNPELAGRYFRNLAACNLSPAQVIGDTTATDLDLDAVFDSLDHTATPIGQQTLYARLRLPSSEEDIARFIADTGKFEADPALAQRCTTKLQRLAGNDSYDIQGLIFDRPEKVRHIRLIYLLTTVALLSLAGALVHPLFLLLFLPLFAANAYLHYSNKIRITIYLSAVAQLRRSIRTAKSLAAEPALAGSYDTSFLRGTNTIERHSRIIGLQDGSGNDFAVIFWILIELIKITCNAEIILYHRFAETIAAEREVIHSLFRFVGAVDAAISVARLKVERPTCQPQFVSGKRLEIKQTVHPLIPECEPNSLTLDQQSLLLTGSNMSGKTTFIRTLCINVLLAQTLGVCFAESYSAPYMRIYTSIRVSDDIEAGISYYLAEVLAIREFLRAAEGDTPCLFALDELFKGTNTTERIAAGKAVLARLNSGKHMVCAATHDTELTGLLDGGYALYHFCEQVQDSRLAFDYRLHEGGLITRNAIRILELYDYPADVVADACRTQEKLTRSADK